MRRGEDSLTILRQDAQAGTGALTDLLAAGRLMGVPVPDDATVRAGLRTIDLVDIAALSADSRVLVSAHRAVSEQLHHLPEQQVRLDDGWNSDSSKVAIGAVIDHQRRAESDLHVLRTLTDATAAAASGIDRLLRTFYLTVARLSAPTAAGVPPAELPQAVLTGRVPLGVAIEDVRSRVELFTAAVDATTRGITGILDILNRSLHGIDDELYPVDQSPTERSVEAARGHTASAQTPSPAQAPPPAGVAAVRGDLTYPQPDTHQPPDGHAPPTPTAPGGALAQTEPAQTEPAQTAPVRTEPLPEGRERDGADVPFRLGGGTAGHLADGHIADGRSAAPAGSAIAGMSGVTSESQPAQKGSTESTHVVADTRGGRTAPDPDAAPDPDTAPDASPGRSAGDLALAGDQ
ncbi:hypothetical protein GDN83_13720 [Gordonia jinghuaiqii]|uniref:Uncharacterized protein n=1 Tax=Gordonia jinghuaiqii TaxID=2758710 RepID=A0A7D7LU31_9ACTN|nr:hypothetical protein [Gordonia jinghuaiqii]MCR5978775.1 hypothetical protein [Gordonia jinghuaiqii]QMT03080.1 hypothetical protein H1R19_08200 [Gordonia jinghuaiqii]